MSDLVVKNAIELFRRKLRELPNFPHPDFQRLFSGNSQEFLTFYRHLLCEYNPSLTTKLLDLGFQVTGASDQKFMENMYKLLRDEFNYHPHITRSQFFTQGYAEKKIEMATDVCCKVSSWIKSLENSTTSKRRHHVSQKKTFQTTTSKISKNEDHLTSSNDSVEIIDVNPGQMGKSIPIQYTQASSRIRPYSSQSMSSVPINVSCKFNDVGLSQHTHSTRYPPEDYLPRSHSSSSTFKSLMSSSQTRTDPTDSQPLRNGTVGKHLNSYQGRGISVPIEEINALPMSHEMRYTSSASVQTSSEMGCWMSNEDKQRILDKLDDIMARITLLENRIQFLENPPLSFNAHMETDNGNIRPGSSGFGNPSSLTQNSQSSKNWTVANGDFADVSDIRSGENRRVPLSFSSDPKQAPPPQFSRNYLTDSSSFTEPPKLNRFPSSQSLSRDNSHVTSNATDFPKKVPVQEVLDYPVVLRPFQDVERRNNTLTNLEESQQESTLTEKSRAQISNHNYEGASSRLPTTYEDQAKRIEAILMETKTLLTSRTS